MPRSISDNALKYSCYCQTHNRLIKQFRTHNSEPTSNNVPAHGYLDIELNLLCSDDRAQDMYVRILYQELGRINSTWDRV